MLHPGSLLADPPGRGAAVEARREPRSGNISSATRSDHDGNIRAHTEGGFCGESGLNQTRDGGRVAPAMIGLGLVLTLAWSGSLLWLFVRMIVAVV
jgi:hypothetical protein